MRRRRELTSSEQSLLDFFTNRQIKEFCLETTNKWNLGYYTYYGWVITHVHFYKNQLVYFKFPRFIFRADLFYNISPVRDKLKAIPGRCRSSYPEEIIGTAFVLIKTGI